jgi:hypothetical protein
MSLLYLAGGLLGLPSFGRITRGYITLNPFQAQLLPYTVLPLESSEKTTCERECDDPIWMVIWGVVLG